MVFILCEDVVEATIIIGFAPRPRFVRVVALRFVPACAFGGVIAQPEITYFLTDG